MSNRYGEIWTRDCSDAEFLPPCPICGRRIKDTEDVVLLRTEHIFALGHDVCPQQGELPNA